MRSISKRIACVCVVLIFWSAIAFATHQDSDATESGICTVCIAAHSAAPEALPTPLHVTFVAISTLRAEPSISAKQRLVTFALSVRPPPEF
jgi:hypothetical protein